MRQINLPEFSSLWKHLWFVFGKLRFGRHRSVPVSLCAFCWAYFVSRCDWLFYNSDKVCGGDNKQGFTNMRLWISLRRKIRTASPSEQKQQNCKSTEEKLFWPCLLPSDSCRDATVSFYCGQTILLHLGWKLPHALTPLIERQWARKITTTSLLYR